MNAGLSETWLARLSAFVAATLGLHFPPARWAELGRLIGAAAQEFGYADAEQYARWLLEAPLTRTQVEWLAANLTISETYFWREPQVFEALRRSIFPSLIKARAATSRRLRIWSAGCATGEEVYTLAILLHELIPALQDWRITLLATDINPHVLRHASAGVYGEWSFRSAPPGFKDRYFQATDDGHFQISPSLRQMVTFAYLNLAEAGYPSVLNNTAAMDLIFCRNVLFYFVPAHAQLVRQRLHQALVEGGWLVVAAGELSQHNYAQFTPVQFPGAFVYRRAALPDPAPVAWAAPPSVEAVLAAPAAQLVAVAAETPAPDLALTVRGLANRGQLIEALAACEHALAADKLDPVLHYLHASILQEQQQVSAAQAALNRALYLDPSFVVAHFTLGMVAQRQGQLAAAKKSFQYTLGLLSGLEAGQLVPEADGLTAGRLIEIVSARLELGAPNR